MHSFNLTWSIALSAGVLIVLIALPFLQNVLGFSDTWRTIILVVGIIFILINIILFFYLRSKRIRQ